MNNFNTVLVCLICCALSACGGSSSGSSETPDVTPMPTPTPAVDPVVSFSISDAPLDSVTSVNVTFDSITLKSANDNQDDDSGILLPVLDSEGNASTITIDLMQYQNGDEKLLIGNTSIAEGDYSHLILNTSGCPQNQNGSTEFCWVIDQDGRKPLKTPSNKLKLGEFSVTNVAEQSYTIEFNLRSSLVSTANGASYNLKPHGVRIIDAMTDSMLLGDVDVNLLTAGEGCEGVFQVDTDHGKVVYLYQHNFANNETMMDEYDVDIVKNTLPVDAVKPIASTNVSFDSEQNRYFYNFAHLMAGEYTVAFSCSAIGDDPEEYDGIVIANPESQRHTLTLLENTQLTQHFTE